MYPWYTVVRAVRGGPCYREADFGEYHASVHIEGGAGAGHGGAVAWRSAMRGT